MNFTGLILTLGIISGQSIKLPLFTQGGVIVLDIVVISLCVLGLLKLRFKLRNPPAFIIGALAFIFVATLSLAFTPLHLLPAQYLNSFLYTVRFASYILLAWLIISDAFPALKNIPQILSFSGLGLAILGLMQFIFLPDLRFLATSSWDPHYYRTVSTFLDPNFLGAFLVLTLLLLVFHLGGGLLLTPRKFYIMFTIIYLAILTTFSRSAYGMFLVSFLCLAFLKRSAKLAILTTVLFAILLFSFQIYIGGVNRVTPLDRGQTASFRLSTWQQGFEIFSKSPLLGVGFNTYNFALRQYHLGDQQFLSGKGSTTNDSSLLYILATTGTLGIFAYFLFLRGLIKTRDHILYAAILGLLANSFFINSLFYPFILVWLILIAANSYGKAT